MFYARTNESQAARENLYDGCCCIDMSRAIRNRFNRRIAAFYLSLLPCITHLGEKIPTPDQ